jgi:transcriptional regulator with XRE-family HTH domain
MESDEPRFEHIGLSSEGTVVFCELDNGKTYAMPLCALEKAENWDLNAKPKRVRIIHDGYAAVVEFDSKAEIDFPSDFVLHICEPAYAWHKDKARAMTGVGARIRQIREARGLTLDTLAARCGIAKPNLSRIENDKVTPQYPTLNVIAAALGSHAKLLTCDAKPEHAWTWTQFIFGRWRSGLLFKPGRSHEIVPATKVVEVFLAIHPEHEYARRKLLSHDPKGRELTVDADLWAREGAAAKRAEKRLGSTQRRKEPAAVKE